MGLFSKIKTRIFFLFVQFKAFVEMHSDHKLTMLRTNTGGEFNSTKFHDYCKTQWIKKELIIRYTLQHNGVLKRKNRSMWRWQEAY